MSSISGNPDAGRLREEIISQLKQRPRNFLLLGSTGVGKSAFINSIAAAQSGKYSDHATSGDHGGGAMPITNFMKSYENCGLDKKCCKEMFHGSKISLPTLVDMAGLPNEEGDGIYEELIRAVLYGRLPKNMSIVRAVEILNAEGGIKALRSMYPTRKPGDLKIDGVIFLASATETALPGELIRCVVKTCRPSGTASDNYKTRVVPLYGVMTKTDKADVSSSTYTTLENKFLTALGIMGSSHGRFMRCRNYCDLTAPDRFTANSPDLDVPLLTFLKRLTDPSVVVDNDTEEEDFTTFFSRWCSIL